MTVTATTPEIFTSLETRLSTLDRRVTKMETIVTTSRQHLATKADVKEAMNTQLRWMIGLFVGSFLGLATLLYTSQSSLEDRLNRTMDARFEQMDARFEQVERRFEQMDRRLDQMDRRLDQIDKRLDRVEQRLERIEQAVFSPVSPRQTR